MEISREQPEHDKEAGQGDEDDGKPGEILAAWIRVAIIDGITLAQQRVDAKMDHGTRDSALIVG